MADRELPVSCLPLGEHNSKWPGSLPSERRLSSALNHPSWEVTCGFFGGPSLLEITLLLRIPHSAVRGKNENGKIADELQLI